MVNDTNPFGAWQPWSPQEVASLFSKVDVPWWIAGGWALDLFLGKQTREHNDIDVQILRRDQQTIRARLDQWNVQGAHPHTAPAEWPFREWMSGTLLPDEVHDVWCRPRQADPWAIQLMIGDSHEDNWLCRRDACIFRPITTIGLRTADGIPYLAPEIQLLYKAKGLRPKDEADFIRTLPHLNQEQRQWLVWTLTIVHPGHHWLLSLKD